MSLRISVAGRFALDAAASGEGEVCAVFRRSFYLRFPGERYACVGDASLGRGPLNALASIHEIPAMGTRLALDVGSAVPWRPPAPPTQCSPDVAALRRAVRGRIPVEGLGCLILGEHNALSGHAQPALDALDRWLVGNALEGDAQGLIGLGPGLTPSGDDYLGGVLVALHAFGRRVQAAGLWRWLEPRLSRTSAISGAHLAAAAAGEAHETLHACIAALCSPDADWPAMLAALDNVGHSSGWDSLAGIAAVAKLA